MDTRNMASRYDWACSWRNLRLFAITFNKKVLLKNKFKTEAELKEVKTQLSDKQAQLEKHFAESAELFKTLIGDYQKLYRHYAVSSETLLGNKPANKGLFTQQLVTASPESKSEEPPRDYSEGSSGLLKNR